MLTILAEAVPEMTWWSFVEKIGFPGAVVIALLYGLFLVVRWTGNKIFLPFAQSHLELVESTKKANTTNAEANKINADTSQKIVQMMETQFGVNKAK